MLKLWLLLLASHGVFWEASAAKILRTKQAGRADDEHAPNPTHVEGLAEGTECYDISENWTDVEGHTCATYAEKEYCTRDGGVQLGLKSLENAIDSATGDGVTANDACCICGGGVLKECTGVCNAAKTKAANEVEQQFEQLAVETGEEVDKAGAQAVSQAANALNAGVTSESAQIQSVGDQQANEAVKNEELAFADLTFGFDALPSLAGAQLGGVGGEAASLQLGIDLGMIDSAKLAEMAKEVSSKFADAHAQWELARDDALAALMLSNTAGDNATSELNQSLNATAQSYDMAVDEATSDAVQQEAVWEQEEVHVEEEVIHQLQESAASVEAAAQEAEDFANQAMIVPAASNEDVQNLLAQVETATQHIQTLQEHMQNLSSQQQTAEQQEEVQNLQAQISQQQELVEELQHETVQAEINALINQESTTSTTSFICSQALGDATRRAQEAQVELDGFKAGASTVTVAQLESELAAHQVGASSISQELETADFRIEALTNSLKTTQSAPSPTHFATAEQTSEAEAEARITQLEDELCVAETNEKNAKALILEVEMNVSREVQVLDAEVGRLSSAGTTASYQTIKDELDNFRLQAAGITEQTLQDQINAVSMQQALHGAIQQLRVQVEISTASVASATHAANESTHEVNLEMSLAELLQHNDESLARLGPVVDRLEAESES